MFLKNRNIIFKTKISKVTDYAALIKSLQKGMILVTSVVMSTFSCKGSLVNNHRTTQMKSLTLKRSFIMLLIRSVAILYLGGTGLTLGFEKGISFIVFSTLSVSLSAFSLRLGILNLLKHTHYPHFVESRP